MSQLLSLGSASSRSGNFGQPTKAVDDGGSRSFLLSMHGTGRVIPLIIDGGGESSLHSALWEFQYIDFRGDFNHPLQKLFVNLASLRQGAPLARLKSKAKGLYAIISYAAEEEAFGEERRAHMKRRGYAYWD